MTKMQYDRIAEEYSQMFNPTKKYVLIPTFRKILGNVREKSALDLACGEGFFTRILAGLKPSELRGIDISKELIKRAIKFEKQHPLKIEYDVGDVLNLRLGRTFDLITAVYLLNYAASAGELATMCKAIYSHLAEGGNFCTITLNPYFKPMDDFEYDRRFTNVNGKNLFENGDKVKCEVKEKGKKQFEFRCYYWSKGTYEARLSAAGFKSIKWIDAVISPEGIKEYGEKYWDKYRKNHSPIGIVCIK